MVFRRPKDVDAPGTGSSARPTMIFESEGSRARGRFFASKKIVSGDITDSDLGLILPASNFEKWEGPRASYQAWIPPSLKPIEAIGGHQNRKE